MICSNFLTEAILWILEVEMANSVDELKSSCSIQVITPFFPMSSCSTRGLHQSWARLSRIPRKKDQKADRFLRGRQIAYLIYENIRVTGVDDSVLDHADLFAVVLRNDNIQEFDTRWDEILWSMEQFPRDDILESLYKLGIRESGKTQDRVGIVQLGDS